jgi:hypothetical protein
VLRQVADAVGVPLRQCQLLLQGLRGEGDQTDVAVEFVIRHRQTSLFVSSPVALARDLGLDVAVLAVELRGDFRLGAGARLHGLAGLQADQRISAGDMLSVLHMDGADRALPGRAQANHAGGRLQVSRREFHARECAPRDEDASAREDHGENRDHQGCMARRMRQQPARLENFPVALRTCGRNSGGLTAAAASSLDAVMTGPIPANAQS